MKKWMMLGLALCIGAGPALPLVAGEVPENAAAKVSMTWLSLVDAGKYGQSWDGAAELFQQALTRSQWESALEKVRAPLGRVLSRKLKTAKFTRELPGAPAGDYVVIQYDTDFEKKSAATETVTPMKGKDGVWRVSGYFIK